MYKNNLKKILKSKNINQSELSRIANVPRTNIVSIINGQINNPTIGLMIKIADALNISLDEFRGDNTNDK
ncbi:helix-turn-helix transcriptional regulator [Companilactobacillus pabuli]|uniref:helix-turn-helix transcriptional regulator n=1 Tax=Companilactobacillus pabuli TaxID=2714036 RepID=UPI0024173899|nr:helix-turn-helix transcriptional regulator [Companilactobacillus pabuli]MDG5112665.1 helix-turn-helix transcriptional regulator [Companilactobacillus pabuli]